MLRPELSTNQLTIIYNVTEFCRPSIKFNYWIAVCFQLDKNNHTVAATRHIAISNITHNIWSESLKSQKSVCLSNRVGVQSFQVHFRVTTQLWPHGCRHVRVDANKLWRFLKTLKFITEITVLVLFPASVLVSLKLYTKPSKTFIIWHTINFIIYLWTYEICNNFNYVNIHMNLYENTQEHVNYF